MSRASRMPCRRASWSPSIASTMESSPPAEKAPSAPVTMATRTSGSWSMSSPTQAPRDAEDIASQAWLEVARGLPRFSGGEDDFRALVFTIARRRLANHRRATRRRPVDLAGDETLAALPGGEAAEDEALTRLRGE